MLNCSSEISIFLLPVWARGIRPSPIGKLDPKTMGVAVGIALIFNVQAEIHAFEVYRPLSWSFPLPVWSHSILMSPIGKLDPENIGMAVGISLTSCLEAEIHAFEVWRPPSWIFPFPVQLHSILMSPNVKLDPENIGIASEFR